MATIKNNLNNISEDTQSLIKDYLKLFSVKLSEKLALVLGILASVFILSILLLVVAVFCSFALATYLNNVLSSELGGYWIITAFYLLVIVLLVVRMRITKKPLLADFFVNFIVSILDVDTSRINNLQGIKHEGENVRQKIETDKIKIKSNFQLLSYTIMESFLKEFFGLFKSKNKKPDDTESHKEDIEE